MISDKLKEKLKNCADFKYINWTEAMPIVSSHTIDDKLSFNKSNLLAIRDLKLKCNKCDNELKKIILEINNLLTCNEYIIKKLLE